jgi:glycosyltransferase involved in cell wall biosynthesis
MAEMLLSLISGTFNRLPSLKAMLESAEASMPKGIDWEACICDGGSTDGTLEYLRQHPRVKLIEHGALRGAIAAFNDAGKAATGDLILVANDDIEFVGYSIAHGLSFMMDRPDVGGG